MKKFIQLSFLTFSFIALAHSQLTIDERIVESENERSVLRARILENKYFAQRTIGKSGDEIELLIYSAGNFLTDGTEEVVSNGESLLQKEGRRVASDERSDEAAAADLRAYIKNRNLLNSLYLQRSRSRNY